MQLSELEMLHGRRSLDEWSSREIVKNLSKNVFCYRID